MGNMPNESLMNYIKLLADDVSNKNFGNMFPLVSDSVLTSFMLFFLAGWIMSICFSLGKGSK